jgi:MAP3K TRAFs-binding domain
VNDTGVLMASQPLCFVLMPFGSKADPAGGPSIDFDRIYDKAVRPGVEAADMLPIRADEERLGGIIHKAMFERLLVCDYAVADLTTSNPNVMYELGIRHAARPRTTLTVFAESSPLPFDLTLLRTQPYQLGDHNEFPESRADLLRAAVERHLRELRSAAETTAGIEDSPLFQLVSGWNPQPLPLAAAQSFQDQVLAHEQVKQRLAAIRSESLSGQERASAAAELTQLSAELLAEGPSDPGVLTELMLSHRSFKAWSGMIDVYEAMPAVLKQQTLTRQQVAFAYNRRAETTGQDKDRAQALRILEEVLREQGPDSETYGLLGRIYKSQWMAAMSAHDLPKAREFLVKAVRAYTRGFETDWRDVYPGINAITLLEVQGGEKALRQKERLLPVVRFAAEQRLGGANPTYWDHATILELAVLASDVEKALDVLDDVVATYTESFQPETTAGNLRIIDEGRRRRGMSTEWMQPIIEALDVAAGSDAAGPS